MIASRLILLVDDDQDLLTALSGALRQRGYEVAVALDAVAAMSAAVRLKPQVVVLDVGLPGGEGVRGHEAHARPAAAGRRAGRHDERPRPAAVPRRSAAYSASRRRVVVAILALAKPVGRLRRAWSRPLATSSRTWARDGRADRVALARQARPRRRIAGKLVLLVDDDEDLLVALAAPLRRQGFDVAVATDAVTAVSTAVKQPPDVVIMDIGLPGRRRHDGDAAAALPAAAGRRARDHAQRARPREAPGRRRSPPAPPPTSPSPSRPDGAHRRRRRGAGRRRPLRPESPAPSRDRVVPWPDRQADPPRSRHPHAGRRCRRGSSSSRRTARTEPEGRSW